MTLVTLSILLLVLSVCPSIQQHPGNIPRCCYRLTSTDMSERVISNTYQELPARKHVCPKAIKFKTTTGEIYASPGLTWVQTLIKRMTKIKGDLLPVTQKNCFTWSSRVRKHHL
ncbi:hypothetical protein FQA47_016713 [Oryzias melastigma]|uniref:Chemokine interleukin-8-like domain-containing protein n=1 Tax=Oryzias melastigma TaxID=30732 RepID=A0A834F219_ORYME|nr:hypothetical protein FQA47_016713 [Oryzias melastigma]